MMLNDNNGPELSPEESERVDELLAIVKTLVYDHCPRQVTLGRADQMVESIVFQISTGLLISLTKLSPNNPNSNEAN